MKKNKFLESIVLFLMIFLGSNTLTASSIIGNYTSIIIVFFLSISLLSYQIFIRKKFLKINLGYLLFISLLIASLLLSSLLNSLKKDISNGDLLLILKIVQGVFIALIISKGDFKKIFTTIMAMFSIYSIISLFIFMNTAIVNLARTFINPSGLRFYNFGFSYVLDAIGHFGVRNYSIFTEPAMHVCFLLPALTFELFSNSNPRLWVIMGLSIAGLTTFSPIGVIGVISLNLLYIIYGNVKIKRSYFISILVLFCFSIFLINSNKYGSAIQATFNKFEEISTGENSRFDAIQLNLEMWLRKPLFGNGLDSIVEVTNKLGSNTSTNTAFLNAYGVVFNLPMLLGLYSFFREMKLNRILNCTILLIYLMAINGQALIHTDFYWIFVMIGGYSFFSQSRKKR